MPSDRYILYQYNSALAINETLSLPFKLDPVQELIVASERKRIIVNCCRQWGKTSTIAAKVAIQAVLNPGLILIIAPVERQAKELFRKAKDGINAYIRRTHSALEFWENAKTSLELSNGARVIALPAKGETIRGYTDPSLIVIDEAAFTQDEDYRAIRPMLSHGASLIVMSTPFGKRGWFYDTWSHKNPIWARFSVVADNCKHISRDFLEDERISIGPWWYDQEYNCQFLDDIAGFYDMDSIRAAIEAGDPPILVSPSSGFSYLIDQDSKPFVIGGAL